ncbi:MAG: GNAT family N-acetyltransferase [Geminicoccaceae bacterium]
MIAGVEAAFEPHVARIGKPPAPMLADDAALIGAGRVQVLEDAGVLAGILVLAPRSDRLVVEVLAIRPDRHGHGLGRRLMRFAESVAQSKGLDKVALYTHERMVEALSFYRGLGYVGTERRSRTATRAGTCARPSSHELPRARSAALRVPAFAQETVDAWRSWLPAAPASSATM